MKTREQILKAVKEGKKPQCIDNRDFARLLRFFPIEDWELFGFTPKEGVEHAPEDFTVENVLARLKSDVEFGFQKALDQRGISSSLMHEVVKMWLWVLEDDLINFDEYAMYGLPLLKAVAVKYGFDNPIGEDTGSERKYDSDSYYD